MSRAAQARFSATRAGAAARLAAALCVASLALVPACRASGPLRPEIRNDATPLDRYVAAPDPAYAWEPIRDLAGAGCCVAHVLKMTSQSWLTPQDVDRTLWWHWLTIVEPEMITSDAALLYIHSGTNDDGPPDSIRPIYARIARATGSVVAELRMVPNQPLRFAGDPDAPRREDRLIAFGWSKFLRGGDPTWLARLPMTKSAVRAMDTITSWFESRSAGAPRAGRPGGSPPNVGHFVIVGASKRGWATWTTAAVDRRVAAIMPMALPKLLINAAGDQFFVPDSSRLCYDDLPGEKHLRYVPNADHAMRGTDVDESVLAFYRAVVQGAARPELSWSFEPDGSIRVRPGGAAGRNVRPALRRRFRGPPEEGICPPEGLTGPGAGRYDS